MNKETARQLVVNGITENLCEYEEIVRIAVVLFVSGWTKDELADFLWGDDRPEEIEE